MACAIPRKMPCKRKRAGREETAQADATRRITERTEPIAIMRLKPLS
jgi:hypothetical protein